MTITRAASHTHSLSPVRGEPHSRRVGWREDLVVLAGLLLVALIALIDYATGPYLSTSVFYLLPVAVCAWWGGFSHGLLLALIGATAWHTIDVLETPTVPAAAEVWNSVVRFCTLALVSSLVSRLHDGVLRERRLARTDALTGAANGRTFYEVAAAEAERSRRGGRPLTLAYLDLDNFKQLNDRLGHATGDAALVHLVRSVQINLREYDLLARLGGDEFALLLPETEGDSAQSTLSRLQALLSEGMAGKGWPVTVSIGGGTFLRPSTDVDLMIRRVDALMYAAKRKGKGRVEHTVIAEFPDTEGCLERRATAGVLGNRIAKVRREGQEPAQGDFATVFDITASRVGLYLDKEFPPDTLLLVEPMSSGARTLLVRVEQATHEPGRWRYRCELATRLGADEIQRWLGEQLAPLADRSPAPAKTE